MPDECPDTEKLSGILSTLGYGPSSDEQEADLILINTCSVREGKAAQKVFTRLGQLKILKEGQTRPCARVCGCLAQQEGDVFLKGRPYVDMVFGPKNARDLPQMLASCKAERGQLLELSVRGRNPRLKWKPCCAIRRSRPTSRSWKGATSSARFAWCRSCGAGKSAAIRIRFCRRPGASPIGVTRRSVFSGKT